MDPATHVETGTTPTPSLRELLESVLKEEFARGLAASNTLSANEKSAVLRLCDKLDLRDQNVLDLFEPEEA